MIKPGAMPMIRRGLVFLGLVLLSACGGLPRQPDPAQVAPVADLLAVFDRLALGLGQNANPVGRALKWVTPILVQLQDANSESDRIVVRKAFDAATALTGIPYRFAQTGQKPNFYVRFVAQKDVFPEVAKLRGGLDKVKGLPPESICFAHPTGKNNIIGAHILIAGNLGNEVRDICVLHEMMHAFGLIGHHRRYNPSILYHADMSRQGFSINDKIILRTLYDSRIYAGMKREDALPVAEKIIRDLVDQLATAVRPSNVLNQPLKW